MAYKPTTWTTGDVITADKLNNIESGVTNATINIISQADYDALADKTGVYFIEG